MWGKGGGGRGAGGEGEERDEEEREGEEREGGGLWERCRSGGKGGEKVAVRGLHLPFP